MSFIRFTGQAATLKALERKCSACGKTQTVPQDQIKAYVPCKYCKKPMPPKERR